MAQHVSSNYLGNGKRYDGADGTQVAVSRGPAGEFMYDYETIRAEADRLGGTVRFWCPLNNVAIAGVVADGAGPVIDIELGREGFLTRGVRIWYRPEASR